MMSSASFASSSPPARRGSSAEGVRRAARRMVQEQLAQRTVTRRAAHVARVEKDLVTQAAARVLVHFSRGLQLGPPVEGGVAAALQKRAQKLLAAQKNGDKKKKKRRKGAIREAELMSMKGMAAALKAPGLGGAERIQLLCTMARVNADSERYESALKLFHKALRVQRSLVSAELGHIHRDDSEQENVPATTPSTAQTAASSSSAPSPSPQQRRRGHRVDRLASMSAPAVSKRTLRQRHLEEQARRIPLRKLRQWGREIILSIARVHLSCCAPTHEPDLLQLLDEYMTLHPSLPPPPPPTTEEGGPGAGQRGSEEGAGFPSVHPLRGAGAGAAVESSRSGPERGGGAATPPPEHAGVAVVPDDLADVLAVLTSSKMLRRKNRDLMAAEEETRVRAADTGSLGHVHDYIVGLLERICAAQGFRDRAFGDYLLRMYVNQQDVPRAKELFVRLEMAVHGQ